MRNLILTILLLISIFLGGCALVSPFKPINSCSNVKDGGANCALISDNLEYSMSQDNKTTESEPKPTDVKSADVKSADTSGDNATLSVPHADIDVEKAELVRHLAESKVVGASGNRPVMLPPATYRVFIMPYTDGARYYSGRYVYITSGKPRWVSGNKVISGDTYISVDLPEQPVKKLSQAEQISNITFARPPVITPAPKVTDVTEPKPTPKREEKGSSAANTALAKSVKHRVAAYLLNCRDVPSIEGTSIAVFEQDRIVEITDKSLDWWKVSFYELECYVNSKYLYAEPVR